MNFDRSHILHSTQRTPLKGNMTQLASREDTLNLTPIYNESSYFKSLNESSLRHILDESSVIISNENAGNGLSEIFFEIIQSSRPSDVLETLARLAQACCDSLELVEPWNRYSAHNYWLVEEANTWKLLHCLFVDSLIEHPESFESIITQSTLSQQSLVDALFQSDSELRLFQLLVDWLEASAAYQDQATRTSAPVISNNIHWGNTLHQLLLGTSLFNKERNKAMVTQMDPDACTRQNKNIHSDDLKDDNDLCKMVFTEIRCGNFNNAISQCINAGQAWRGAVLQGWKLLHYLQKEEPVSIKELNGNKSRDLWKWCALGIAGNISENCYYRAAIGILCGHLQSALTACQGNWEDLLWAHLRVQIETRVDKFLHEHYATAEANTTTPEVLELLQSELQPSEISLQQIFSAVKSILNGKKESNYQTCQRYLMLGHVRSIMQESLLWLQSAEDRFIRFLAHLVLILRQMGKDPQHDSGDIILDKYVTQLIDNLVNGSCDYPELIAFYISVLPNERQIGLFADLMDRIYKRENRPDTVKAGKTAGIDVAASARKAIKKAITDIQQSYGNIDATLTQTTSVEKDKTLINRVILSLEWLSLQPNQVAEALWLSNEMMRTFIFINNTEAAISCLGSIKHMFPEFMKQLSPTSSELREHLCLKAYIEALEGFATWYRHFISGQPKDVEPLPIDATFADKVHHEQKVAQVEQQKARWRNAVLHQTRHTKTLLYNTLLFPGGWLQDENDSTSSLNFTREEKVERFKQLETMRKLCIPEIVILILKILQSNNDIDSHREAVKLSDLIAAENRCLYKVFTKSKLQEVLERIKESSLILIEKGRDMFGFDVVE